MQIQIHIFRGRSSLSFAFSFDRAALQWKQTREQWLLDRRRRKPGRSPQQMGILGCIPFPRGLSTKFEPYYSLNHYCYWENDLNVSDLSLKMASAQVDETSVTNNSHHRTPITQIIFFIQGIIVIDMVNKGSINWNWLFLLAVAEF